ncbi:hypothetical protein FGM00_07120 [Aggregatimonas sangjinii]|uniref:Uncharacterized protein n=1 Tax=Aggregatimonas sangjinii TaxID=2583587 RepID=A0A5B7SSC8_9FLAO|nr:hypothetical protein [Aggregatimonas sangjinii]QCW99880.1 hypothetical protein FGM00_07120 [Aggregatimonas sangjinii]
MSNEHNPVAQLVTQIQQKWLREVSPHDDVRWVRWLIKPEQARLYEGFLKLESTEHGSIPDIPVVLLTPFESSKVHSRQLAKDWLQSFENDTQLKQQLEGNFLIFDWDSEYFKTKLADENCDCNLLLIEFLESFQKALPNPEQHLVLALFPYTVQDTEDYRNWMDTLMEIGLPEKTRLMVFDHNPENYFEAVQLKYRASAKTLWLDLDLDDAMKKVALSGDPNDPEVKFRECMVEMGQSAAKNNRKRLHIWGEKGLEITQSTGNKTAFATAHAVYAGMLFQFKEYDTIDKLLQRGLAVAKQSKKAGDESVNAILLQLYAYMATSAHHQKEIDQATDLFCKQAELAASFGMGQQALATYITAYTLIQKKNPSRYASLLKEAFEYGITLPEEQLPSSGIGKISWDYYHHTSGKSKEEIDDFMIQLEGKDWKQKMEIQEKQLKTGISTS